MKISCKYDDTWPITSVASLENKDIFLYNHNIFIIPKDIVSLCNVTSSPLSNFSLMHDQLNVLLWLYLFKKSLSRTPLPPLFYLFVCLMTFEKCGLLVF